jgi:hypothetical protein
MFFNGDDEDPPNTNPSNILNTGGDGSSLDDVLIGRQTTRDTGKGVDVAIDHLVGDGSYDQTEVP